MSESHNRPHFELQRVYSDDTTDEPQIVPITQLPSDTRMGRRGFLGAGVALSSAIAAFSTPGCGKEESGGTAPSAPKVAGDNAPDETAPIESAPEEKAPLYAEQYHYGPAPIAHRGPITGLALIPGGKSIVSSATDARIKIWSTATGTVSDSLYDRAALRKTFERSPYSGAFSLDDLLTLLEKPSRSDVDPKILESIGAQIESLGWTGTGGRTFNKMIPKERDFIIDLFLDGAKRVFRDYAIAHYLGTGVNDRELRQGVGVIKVSPDGRTLLSAGRQDNGLRLWSLETHDLIARIEEKQIGDHADEIVEIEFVPGTSLVVTRVRYEPHLCVWSLSERKLLRRLEDPEGRTHIFPESMRVSPDGTCVIVGGSLGIWAWSLPDGRLLGYQCSQLQVHALAISKDGRVVASGAEDEVRLWKVPDLEPIKSMHEDSREIDPNRPFDKKVGEKLFAVSPDGRLLASATRNTHGELRIFSLPSGDLVCKPNAEGLGRVTAMCFTSDGATLVTACGEFGSMIRCWSTRDGEQQGKTFAGQPDVTSLLVLPGDRFVATGSSGATHGAIFLWDLKRHAFHGLLFDPLANPRPDPDRNFDRFGVKAQRFSLREPGSGRELVATVPIDYPVPSAATCTCNLVLASGAPRPVPGSINYTSGAGPQSVMTIDRVCTCNSVCTCVPVCQAHQLLHPDATIHTMAEQLLFWMGLKELCYLRWAARTAESHQLAERIREITKQIVRGQRATIHRWPSVAECVSHLTNADEIIRIMAAQMLRMRSTIDGISIDPSIATLVELHLQAALDRPWYLRHRGFGL
jgi:WD40 repeat protein